jgi:hypothetical protein
MGKKKRAGPFERAHHRGAGLVVIVDYHVIGFPDGYLPAGYARVGTLGSLRLGNRPRNGLLGYGLLDPGPRPPRHVRALKRAGLRGRRDPSDPTGSKWA